MISILVAIAENGAIGKDNKLLWHLPNDMRFFKNLTWGSVVVMGRKTFESIGKPLPGRVNIVITSNGDWSIDGVQKATSIDEALKLAKETNCKEVFVIGGGEIYKQTIPLAKKMYITRVHHAFDADVYFPQYDGAEWKMTDKLDFFIDEKHQYNYSFETWIKKP